MNGAFNPLVDVITPGFICVKTLGLYETKKLEENENAASKQPYLLVSRSI